MIFFIQAFVCHRVIRNRREIALFRGEQEMSLGPPARTTMLHFMCEGPPRYRDTVRDNLPEEAQPTKIDHQVARRTETEIRRCSDLIRFGGLSSGNASFCSSYRLSVVTYIGD